MLNNFHAFIYDIIGAWGNENIIKEYRQNEETFKDLTEIVTPIKVDKYKNYLMESGFDREKAKFLIKGFTEGFDIGYRGPLFRKNNSSNIPLRIGTSQELWSKLMKEVKLGRYAGPFDKIPFHQYMQSPIGLVPKSGNQTRLIFHLSYDFGKEEGSKSLNHFTPKHWCKVRYNDLDHAIRNSLRIHKEQKIHKLDMTSSTRGKQEYFQDCVAREIYSCLYYSKSDIKSAFRLVPILPSQRCWLIMMARDPSNGKLAFFADKCLPFGASISCARFQLYSESLRQIIEHVTHRYHTVTNYLDDFLFIAEDENTCNQMVRNFIVLCQNIGCPISYDKTEWASTRTVFLGLLLDGRTLTISIPIEKRDKALKLINYAMDKKKVTIKFIQRLAGTLNFLNKAIIPGRTFTRCMYDKIKMKNKQGQKLKDYHHVNLGSEVIRDCSMWKIFLNQVDYNAMHLCRPFLDLEGKNSSRILNMYSDASLNVRMGYGAIFNDRWICGTWGEAFIKKFQPSIEFLELYALVAAVITWGDHDEMKNSRVTIFCDNQAAMHITNSLTSKCTHSMKLVRMLTMDNIRNNRKIYVEYVKSEENVLADALSRQNFTKFWKFAPKSMNKRQDYVHSSLHPIEKVWDGETDRLLQRMYMTNH